MKILAKPVEVIAWFENKGNITPIRFRMEGEDNSYKVIKVDRVIMKQKEKLAGNFMHIFRCSSVINGVEKVYELKYEINTCKWMLYKM